MTEKVLKFLRTRYADKANNRDDLRFKNAMHLFAGNAQVDRCNAEKQCARDVPIVVVDAVQSSAAATGVVRKPLANTLWLSRGAPVRLTTNLWTEAGLTNGARGSVVDIVYAPGTQQPSQPIAVLCTFPGYTGPSFVEVLPHEPAVVVIEPLQLPIGKRKAHWRQQLPLKLAHASTMHGVQGLSLDTVHVDPGAKETHPGILSVALSRCRTSAGVLIEPVSTDRLLQCGNGPGASLRKTEEKRLQVLFEITCDRWRAQANNAGGPTAWEEASLPKTAVMAMLALGAVLAGDQKRKLDEKIAKKAARQAHTKKISQAAQTTSNQEKPVVHGGNAAVVPPKPPPKPEGPTMFQIKKELSERGINQQGSGYEVLFARLMQARKCIRLRGPSIVPSVQDQDLLAWQCSCLGPANNRHVESVLDCMLCGHTAPHALYLCVCGKNVVFTDATCYSCETPNPHGQRQVAAVDDIRARAERSNLALFRSNMSRRPAQFHSAEAKAARESLAEADKWILREGVWLTMSYHFKLFDNNDMLDDTIISAAGSMLRRQFNLHVTTFQRTNDTLRVRTPASFAGYQLMHLPQAQHWVLSYKRAGSDFTDAYDICGTSLIPRSPEVLNAIWAVYGDTHVDVQCVQHQGSTLLCGDYSIFTAVEILTNGLLTRPFDPKQIRQHLKHCLQTRVFTPCPKLGGRILSR